MRRWRGEDRKEGGRTKEKREKERERTFSPSLSQVKPHFTSYFHSCSFLTTCSLSLSLSLLIRGEGENEKKEEEMDK